MYIYKDVQQSLFPHTSYILTIYIPISVFSSFVHTFVKNGIKGFTVR